MPTKMFYKKDNSFVEVYDIYNNNGRSMALIFSPSLHGQRGNGWDNVKISQLIPAEYCDLTNNKGFQSKTKKNKIKSRLKLDAAIWTCTDGVRFGNVDWAIKHEEELIEKEKETEKIEAVIDWF